MIIDEVANVTEEQTHLAANMSPLTAEALLVHPAAAKLASALRIIAIGRAARLGDGSDGCVAEPLMSVSGVLFCIATPAKDRVGQPLLLNGQQLYQTRWEFRGKVVSRDDAERLLDGQQIEVAA